MLVQKSELPQKCGSFLFLGNMIITSTQHFKQPQKIISLVPSLTELLSYFDLEKEVIGITKFCVHPKTWFTTKTRIGGTKNINVELIKKLQPDLVIANKEENVKEQIEELANELNVWVTDVNTLDNALLMINDIGELTYKSHEASALIALIKNEFFNYKKPSLKISSAYLIWKEPYMTVGGDTFINDMMKCCGLQNIYEDKKRYPEITLQELQSANCQLVLLSSEPYPFKQKDIDELQKVLPGKKIILADGEIFSWYGSRLLEAPQYFKELIKVNGQ
ncbi:MAG: helical backbone metal receptor [Ginsengibacter sp.]